VVGVEPELAADLAESLSVGRRIAWEPARAARTVADALRLGSVGEVPWQVIRERVDDVVTVAEHDILAAVRDLALRARLVAEPGGAVAWAAVRGGAVDPRGRPTVAVLSGGSVDPALLSAVLAGGNAGSAAPGSR
jgi:threonine dehydratase